MTATEVVKRLEALADGSYKRILMNHGAREPVLGVRIADLKELQKHTHLDHRAALDLYATGIYDAQYLAGLIVNAKTMTKGDLRRWLTKGNCTAICGTIVAWVAAESRYGRALALQWIDSKQDNTAQTGWMTLASLVSITDDSDLPLDELKHLVGRVERSIHHAPNLVRYAMNAFVIAVGTYVRELTATALRAAENIGSVAVDMGNTACKVPNALQYLQKVQKRGAIGKKRKSARC